MKISYSLEAYFFNAAFFSVVPHGNELTRLYYEMLLTLHLFGAGTQDDVYKWMYKYYRHRRNTEIIAGIRFMLSNNYLTKKGTKYHLTDKSMLLIAQVERKLKALVSLHVGSNPVGRPKKEK